MIRDYEEPVSDDVIQIDPPQSEDFEESDGENDSLPWYESEEIVEDEPEDEPEDELEDEFEEELEEGLEEYPEEELEEYPEEELEETVMYESDENFEEDEEEDLFASHLHDPIGDLVSDNYCYDDEEEAEEELDDDLTFEDLEVDEGADDGVVYRSISLDDPDEDDDLTFGDLVTDEGADDGLTYESISLEDDEADDDLTFDQLEAFESEDENEANIFYSPIPVDVHSESIEGQSVSDTEESLDEQEDIESFLGDYFAGDDAFVSLSSEREIDLDALSAKIEVTENVEADEELFDESANDDEAVASESLSNTDEIEAQKQTFDVQDEDTLPSDDADDFGFFGEGDELGSYYSEPDYRSDYTPSGADISLLLQFGCEEEVLRIASDEDIESISNEDALDRISMSMPDDEEDEEAEPALTSKDALEAKILSIYNNYAKIRGGMFLRLIAASFISFLLLLYDGLPMLGVSLPGIMDRDFYFMPHVLIGLQLLVICALTSGKKLLKGMLKLFTRASDAYSAVAVLTVGVITYDIVMMTAHIDRPPEFHFLAALAITMAIASDCAEISATMSTYEFFFADVIARADGDVIAQSENAEKCYTLHRSSGQDSVAEKMYRGGLDPDNVVYTPLEIESAVGYFNSAEKQSRKSNATMAIIIPAIVFSVLVGIITFIIQGDGGELWESFGMALISLSLTVPIISIFARWLPFAFFNRKNIKSGFAFAGEYSVEQYANCNVFVFKDMHVLKKCSPKSVNIATYDATSSEVLLGCLSSVYSVIGGPLEDVFAVGENPEEFGKCHIRRIAKSGVEAVIGSNYAVLIGNDQFMSRYGISFPKVSFKHEGDEVFSVCVSINGRASARIVAKYSVNEMFEMFAQRLAEDGIYCALETFDPMVSSELLKKIREDGRPPVSVVHLGADDLKSRSEHKESALFDASGADTGILAKRSRLNLVVAASNAVRGVALRKRVNGYCYFALVVGMLFSIGAMILGAENAMNEFLILLYWLVGLGGLFAFVMLGLPSLDRFSYERFTSEKRPASALAKTKSDSKQNSKNAKKDAKRSKNKKEK